MTDRLVDWFNTLPTAVFSIDYSIDFSDNFQTRIMPYYLKTKYIQKGELA